MVLTGIAGWIDRSLIDSGLFYPPEARSAEERLNFYAGQFQLVEVDSSYYGMPKRENSENWVRRTPPGFVFDVKSFALFTHHPTRPNSLPKEIRELMPAAMLEKNLYLEKTPDDVIDAAWDSFRNALEPLRDSGKLGAVFFQFPPWFFPSRRNLGYLEQVQERMAGFPIAIEFRKREWLDESHREGTIGFLRARDIAYVTVDAPEGFDTALPPLAEATSRKLAVVRFHGRNRETWDLKGAPPNLRFRHDYTDRELAEWVPRIQRLEEMTETVHAIMNNNYSDYSVRNAHQLERLMAIADAQPSSSAEPAP